MSLLAESSINPAGQETRSRRQSLRRSLSLDALRGLAIIGMVLSSMLPYFSNTLPPWMYHAQVPPPAHEYNAALYGMTWVDLVFPLFLFALGAAVPLAITARCEQGASKWGLTGSAIARGILLLFFALYEQHLTPGLLTDSYGKWGYGISILAFVLLFPIFVRLPRSWPSWSKWLIRILGWSAALALLFSVRYDDGSGFTVHRRDIILVILANVAVSTALVRIWLGERVSPKLCIMGLVAVLMLARRFTPWGIPVTDLQILQPLLGDWLYHGIVWAFRPAYQQYLLITMPGLIAGEILTGWLRPGAQRLSFSIQNSRWRQLSMVRCLGLAIVCATIALCNVIAFTLHDWAFSIIITLALSFMGFVLLYSPPARKQVRLNAGLRGQPRISALVFRSLFTWGVVWLALGVALYFDEGGIRKDPPTFSYMFVSAGLAHMLLIAFAVITDAMHRPALLYPLIDNGQNPMICYVIGSMLVVPILQLIPAGDGSVLDWLTKLTPTPWTAFARGVGLTLIAALLVSGLTRLKIFWRT